MPLPPGFEQIQQDELSRLFGRLAGLRLLFLPVALALTVFVAFTEPARWRTALLAGLSVAGAAFFLAEVARYRRTGLTARAVPVNLLATAGLQVGVALATGALESPFTYTFVPLALVVGVFAEGRARPAIVGLQIAGVWALAALEVAGRVPDLNPAAFGGGARAGHADAHLLTTAAVLSAVMALAARAGVGLRKTFDAMLAQALRAREESRCVHADRAAELTALSAEIAHELKNPLASVKGLAALLADQAPPGKGAERLAVLRREVDRMQSILDEFLNFSRPLVPLALGRVDLRALAREVAALHEGIAHERGVRIEVRGEAAEARCDPRKVKQVLINVLQNALDASPAGEVIAIEVAAAGSEATLRVLDRGPGLEAALGARAFEPGVTTKPRGSGLGLTIARALARQHGGELELEDRPGGGCAAALRLPGAPAAALEAAR